MKKQCIECPWLIKNNHNDKMIENIKRYVENGSRKNTEHICHMINHNIWNEVNENNICFGSLNKIYE